MANSWYRTGTITVTNGSATVAGAGTQFTGNINAGDLLFAPDGNFYEIVTVPDNVTLTIKQKDGTAAYLGSTLSAQAYAIIKTGPNNATVATQLTTLATNWQADRDQYANWLGGTVTGGDGSGNYPLTDALGVSRNVPCPAKIAVMPISALLTGYASAAGTVSATDTVLQAINKLNGNVAGKSPLAGPGSSQAFATGAHTINSFSIINSIFNQLSGSSVGLPATSGSTQTNAVLRLGNLAAGNAVLDMGCNSSGGMWLQGTNLGNLAVNYPLLLNPNGGDILVPGVYSATTASAGNTFVDSTGKLFRSTSSERFKTDIEPLSVDYADKLLLAQPIWYRSLCDGDNPDWSYYGLSAEALAEIDPRYVFLSPQYKTVTETTDKLVHVTEPVSGIEESIEIVDGRAVLTRTPKITDQPVYDEYPLFDQHGQPVLVNVDGEERQAIYRQPRMITRAVPHETRVVDETLPLIPDGVQYERLAVALLSIVQRQQRRIEALEGK